MTPFGNNQFKCVSVSAETTLAEKEIKLLVQPVTGPIILATGKAFTVITNDFMVVSEQPLLPITIISTLYVPLFVYV